LSGVAAPSFRWSELESTDYRQYIQNLKAVGCPEQTIRDLVLAELNERFATRAHAIWQRPQPEWWQKPRDERPSPDQIKQLVALEHEKAGIMKELFGSSPAPQELVDSCFLQLQGDEQNLLFLPQATRQSALQALAEAGFDEKEAAMRAANPNSDPERTLFDDKVKVLQQVLSPDDLKQFRLRSSPRAQWLRTEVQYLDLTPDEFSALLDLRQQRLGSSDDLAGGRPEAIQDVRQLFGDERASEFERVSDPNYLNARYAADRAGVPDEQGDRAGRLTAEAVARAMQMSPEAGSTLSQEEREHQREQLQAQTEAQLNALLGEKGAAALCRNLRRSLNSAWGRSSP
jgi:hypothetical protein